MFPLQCSLFTLLLTTTNATATSSPRALGTGTDSSQSLVPVQISDCGEVPAVVVCKCEPHTVNDPYLHTRTVPSSVERWQIQEHDGYWISPPASC